MLDVHVYGVGRKPGCLIRTSERIITMEMKKSARRPAVSRGYANHLILVLSYIRPVRENYGEDSPYGLELYANEAARKVVPTA